MQEKNKLPKSKTSNQKKGSYLKKKKYFYKFQLKNVMY